MRIFKLRINTIKLKIIAVIDTNFAVLKRKPEKIQACIFRNQTLDLYDNSAALYCWANKPNSSISRVLQWYCMEFKGSNPINYKPDVFQAFFRNCIVMSITVMIFFPFYSSPHSSIIDFHSLF